MRHAHSLRLTRRTRSVDHIDPVLRRHRRSRILVAAARDLCPVRIEADHARAGLRKVRRQTPLRQHDRASGVSQHEGQTLVRVRRVERQAGRARLERAEDADDHLQRALHEDADRLARADAEAAQVVGQLVGPRVQLPVAQPLVF